MDICCPRVWLLTLVMLAYCGLAHSKLCDYSVVTYEDVSAKCSKFTVMILDGFILNKTLSGFGSYSDSEIQSIITNALLQPENSPNCIFTKKIDNKYEDCCAGWTGANCSSVVCDPPCKHGYCAMPSFCVCDDDFTGYRCDDLESQANNVSYKYCYGSSQCYGPKQTSFEDTAVDESTCCSNGGGGWGVDGTSMCQACSEHHYTDTSVVNQTNVLPFRTCLNFGKTYYRTFDGLEYQFSGECTYTLAENHNQGWHVEMSVKQCETIITCDKKISIYIDKGDRIEIQSGKCYINGVLTELLPGDPQSTPNKSFSIDYSGEWLHIESPNGLRVKVDMKSTVYVTLNKDKNIGEPIHGLCGNSNGDPNDDLETKNQEMTTSPVVFGNSYKIVDSSYICSDAGSLRDACLNVADNEQNEAAAECSYIRSQTFHDCHGVVNEGLWYELCMNAHCAEETSEAKRAVVCDVTEAYARLCADKNVTIYWRSLLDCPKDCPAGFEYYDRIPRCPRTCKTLHEVMPSDCYMETASGCDCPVGRFLQNGVCVLPEECMCDFRGVKYNNTDRIQIGCNRCVCYMGRWNCTMDKCSSTCNVYGLSHVKTFDGLKYEFEATRCAYYLVQPIDPNAVDDPASDLSIRILHDHCGEDINDDRNCISGVRIQNQGNVVIINKDSVSINGRDYTEFIHKMPYWTRTLYVKQATSLFILVKGFGYRVLVGFRRVYVSLDPFFDNKVQGICGRFNYNYWDEWTTTTGIKETKAGAFVKSYMHDPGSCAAQTERIAGSECQTNLNEYAKEVCAPIQNDEIWMPCRNLVEFYKFYQQCVSDVCLISRLNVTEVACVIMAQVARECALQGAIIDDWKDHPSIKEMCESTLPCDTIAGDMKYEECAPACSGHCRDVELLDTACEHECIPGCRCPQNQMLSDHGHCVNEDECTCYDKYASLGQNSIEAGSEIERNCERCICTNAKLNCSDIPDCVSDVTCPSNQVYFEDHVLCPSSCETYPQQCDQDQAFTGCSCPEHLTMSPSGTCIEPDTCPCQYNNEWYEPGHEFGVGCKSYRCEHRRWVVTKVETCPGTCWTSGSSNYMTFDGNHYIFEGTCKYTLVKSKNDEFHVTVENAPCGTTGITCYKVVEIFLGDIHIQLMRGIAPKINYYPIPSDEYNDQGIHITKAGLWTFVNIEALNLTIQYDEGTRVLIHLADTWKGLTNGLCGDYNDDQPDDYLGMPDTEFGNSYKTDTTCPDVAPKATNEMVPCYGTDERLQWAHESCSIIREGETFAECRNAMSDTLLDQYHLDCLYDSCRCDKGGDCECLCTALANFAEGCNKINVPVRWRTRWLCPMQCENNMVYSACAAPCPQTCQNIGDEPDATCSSSSCVEGCTCPTGYILSGDNCVTAEKCPCFHNSIEYPIGTSINMNGCDNCVCMGGKFNCSESVCNKTCESEQFMCSDGACINIEFLCDGITDCTDNSDETNCAFSCTSDQFKCNSGKCVPNNVLCDGANNCMLGEDELFCVTTCEEDEFRCETGVCIPLSWRCDDIKDCGEFDSSDEINCTEACNSVDQFRCDNGNCVPGTLRCDQHDDCGDGSDEIDCELTTILKTTVGIASSISTTHLPMSTTTAKSSSAETSNISTSTATPNITSSTPSVTTSVFQTGQAGLPFTTNIPESIIASTGQSESPISSVSPGQSKISPIYGSSKVQETPFTSTAQSVTTSSSEKEQTSAPSTATIPVSTAATKLTSQSSLQSGPTMHETSISHATGVPTTETIGASEKVTHAQSTGTAQSSSKSVSESGQLGSSVAVSTGVTYATTSSPVPRVTSTVQLQTTSASETGKSGRTYTASVTESNTIPAGQSETSPIYGSSKVQETPFTQITSVPASVPEIATSKEVSHASPTGKGPSVTTTEYETGYTGTSSGTSEAVTRVTTASAKPILTSSAPSVTTSISEIGQAEPTLEAIAPGSSIASGSQSLSSLQPLSTVHGTSTQHVIHVSSTTPSVTTSSSEKEETSAPSTASIPVPTAGTKLKWQSSLQSGSTLYKTSIPHATRVPTTETIGASEKVTHAQSTGTAQSSSKSVSESGQLGSSVAVSTGVTYATTSSPVPRVTSTVQLQTTSASETGKSGRTFTASVTESNTIPAGQSETSPIYGSSKVQETPFTQITSVPASVPEIASSKEVTHASSTGKGPSVTTSVYETGYESTSSGTSEAITRVTTVSAKPILTSSAPSVTTSISEIGQAGTTLEAIAPGSNIASGSQSLSSLQPLSTVHGTSTPHVIHVSSTAPSVTTSSSEKEETSAPSTASIPVPTAGTKLTSQSSLQSGSTLYKTSISHATRVPTTETIGASEKVTHAQSTGTAQSSSKSVSESGQLGSSVTVSTGVTYATTSSPVPRVTSTVQLHTTSASETGKSGRTFTASVTESNTIPAGQSETSPIYGSSKVQETPFTQITSVPASVPEIASSKEVTHASSTGKGPSITTSVYETGYESTSSGTSQAITRVSTVSAKPILTSSAPSVTTSISEIGQAGTTLEAIAPGSSIASGSQSLSSLQPLSTVHGTSTPQVIHVSSTAPSVTTSSSEKEQTSAPSTASIPVSTAGTKMTSQTTLQSGSTLYETPISHATRVPTTETIGASEKVTHAQSTGTAQSSSKSVSESGQLGSSVAVSTGVTYATTSSPVPRVTSTVQLQTTSASETGKSGGTFTASVTESNTIPAGQSETSPIYGSSKVQETPFTQITSVPASVPKIASSKEVTHASSTGKGPSVTTSVYETGYESTSSGTSEAITRVTTVSAKPILTSSAPSVTTSISEIGQAGTTLEAIAPGSSIASGSQSLSSLQPLSTVHGTSTPHVIHVSSTAPSVTTSSSEKEETSAPSTASIPVSTAGTKMTSQTTLQSGSTWYETPISHATRVPTTETIGASEKVTHAQSTGTAQSSSKSVSESGQLGSSVTVSTGVTYATTSSPVPRVTSTVQLKTTSASETGKSGGTFTVSVTESNTIPAGQSETSPIYGSSKVEETPFTQITSVPASVPEIATSKEVSHASPTGKGPSVTTSEYETGYTGTSSGTSEAVTRVTTASAKPILTSSAPSVTTSISEIGQAEPTLEAIAPGSSIASGSQSLSSLQPLSTVHGTSTPHVIHVSSTAPSVTTSSSEKEETSAPSTASIPVPTAGTKLTSQSSLQSGSTLYETSISHATRVPTTETIGASEKVTHAKSTGTAQSSSKSVSESGQLGSSVAVSTGVTYATTSSPVPRVTSTVQLQTTSASETGKSGGTFTVSVTESNTIPAGQSETSPIYGSSKVQETPFTQITSVPASVPEIASSKEVTHASSTGKGPSVTTSVYETGYESTSSGTSEAITRVTTVSAKPILTSSAPSVTTSISEIGQAGTTLEAIVPGSSIASGSQSLSSLQPLSTVHGTSTPHVIHVSSTAPSVTTSSSEKEETSAPSTASIPVATAGTKMTSQTTLQSGSTLYETPISHATRVPTTETIGASEKVTHAKSTGTAQSSSKSVSESGQLGSSVAVSTGVTYATTSSPVPRVTSTVQLQTTSASETGKSGGTFTVSVTESNTIPAGQSETSPIYGSSKVQETPFTQITSVPASVPEIATSKEVSHASPTGKGPSVTTSEYETGYTGTSSGTSESVTRVTTASAKPILTSSAPSVTTSISEIGQAGTTLEAIAPGSSIASGSQSLSSLQPLSTVHGTSTPHVIHVSSTAPSVTTSSSEKEETSAPSTASIPVPTAGTKLTSQTTLQSGSTLYETSISHATSVPTTETIYASEKVTHAQSTGTAQSSSKSVSESGQLGSSVAVSTEVTYATTSSPVPRVTSTVQLHTTSASETGKSGRTFTASVTESNTIPAGQSETSPIYGSSKVQETPFTQITSVPASVPEIASSKEVTHASPTGKGPSVTTPVYETGYASTSSGTSEAITRVTTASAKPILTSSVPSVTTSISEIGQAGTTLEAIAPDSSIASGSQSLSSLQPLSTLHGTSTPHVIHVSSTAPSVTTSSSEKEETSAPSTASIPVSTAGIKLASQSSLQPGSSMHETSISHATSVPTTETIGASEKVTHPQSTGTAQSSSKSVSESGQTGSSVAVSTGVIYATTTSPIPRETHTVQLEPTFASQTGQSGTTFTASVTESSTLRAGQSETSPFYSSSEVHETSGTPVTSISAKLPVITTANEVSYISITGKGPSATVTAPPVKPLTTEAEEAGMTFTSSVPWSSLSSQQSTSGEQSSIRTEKVSFSVSSSVFPSTISAAASISQKETSNVLTTLEIPILYTTRYIPSKHGSTAHGMSTKHVSSLPTSVSGRTPTTSSGVTHSAISGGDNCSSSNEDTSNKNLSTAAEHLLQTSSTVLLHNSQGITQHIYLCKCTM